MGNDQSQSNDDQVRTNPLEAEVESIHSAMTRSRSIRATAIGMETGKHNNNELRYLPRGLNRAHDGLVIPKRPYGPPPESTVPASASGEQSPQWGWYINTTPPTPEVYCNRPPKKHHSGSSQGSVDISTASSVSATTTTTHRGASPIFPARKPNPIFQDLQAKNKNNAAGWSSVPL